MLRLTSRCLFMNNVQINIPSVEGPAPPSAPVPLNNTKSKDWVDPIENSFPNRIRGADKPLPDVHPRHYIDGWYAMNTTFFPGSIVPWAAEAAEDAFRFRPFPEYDMRAREALAQVHSPHSHREKILTEMDIKNAHKRTGPSLCTLLDRALSPKKRHETPLMVQRDAGRYEALLPGAGTREVDPRFPYHWDVRDFREYERAKYNMQRFTWNDSEANYMILISAIWDHQAELCAEDFRTFVASVAKQHIEEKIQGVRQQLEGSPIIPPSMQEALSGYSQAEMHSFVRGYLEDLEMQCAVALSKIGSGEWPEVKTLEPYTRLDAFWSSLTTYGHHMEKEVSTKNYEVKRFFRTVTMPMPFNETQFERRLLDTRLWVHRDCVVEYHTTFKRNLVWDTEKFPIQHDPVVPPDETYHRTFSYAFDWKSPQPQLLGGGLEYETRELILGGDTWETIAARLGCSVESLQAVNPDLVPKEGEEPIAFPVEGVAVPKDSRRPRPTSHPWLAPRAVTDTYFAMTKADVEKYQLSYDTLKPVPDNADKFPFEFRYGEDKTFPRAAAPVPGEDSWQSYTRRFLDPELSAEAGPQIPRYNVNPLWPEIHTPGKLRDTPYEEDQTWLNQQQPVLKFEPFYKDGWVNDLPRVNREIIFRSMEWKSP